MPLEHAFSALTRNEFERGLLARTHQHLEQDVGVSVNDHDTHWSEPGTRAHAYRSSAQS